MKRIRAILPRAVTKRPDDALYSRDTHLSIAVFCNPVHKYLAAYHAENSNIMRNFAFASHWLHDILDKKKRYAYLAIGNLRNFRFDAGDSIVVLTLIAWAAIVTPAS